MKKPQQLLNRLARERGLECCHDGACIYGHPGGMQTNGGCQALKERDVKALRRQVTALRSLAIELAARVINGGPPAPTGWLPIDQAPKDGTVVDLWLTMDDGKPGERWPNGQSPWRSLRDDPPTFDDWKPVLLRDTECRHVRDAARDAIVTHAVSYYLIRSDRAEEKLRDGFNEWTEIPK